MNEWMKSEPPATWQSLQAWWSTDDFKRGKKIFERLIEESDAAAAVCMFIVWCAS